MGILSSFFGVSDRTPRRETVVQASKIPEEIAPYVKQISSEAQELYEQEMARGFDPYTGQSIAPLTAEEQQAMSDITGLAGTTTPYIQEALGTYRKGGDEFTGETAEKFMSPYQQAVTDIQLREAQENFEGKVMPKFEADAISQGGGMSGLGTRAGIQAAELQRGQSQLLADIQAKGSQAAFQDARQGFEAQQGRERQMATDIGRTGTALFQGGLAEAGALQTVGQQKRELGQSALDEAYAKFLQEKNFPQQTLAAYTGNIYANPILGKPSKTTTTTGLPGAPSMGQQLLGMGLQGLNMYGAGTAGGQNFSLGNMASTMYGRKNSAAGGQVGGGLPTIHRNIGGGLGDNEPGIPMESYENIGRFMQETEDIPDIEQSTMSDSQQRRAELFQEIKKLQNTLGRRSEESKGISTKLNTDVNAANIAANTRQTNLTDESFNKRESKLEERRNRYPFASIAKGIAAGMKEPTIAMMFTQGIAVTGEELEKKADELDNMVDALEQQKFGAENKQEAEQSARLLENLKGDANLQLKLLELDTKTQIQVLNLMKQGVDIDVALEKARSSSKGKLKLDSTVKETGREMAIDVLGLRSVYEDGKLRIVGDTKKDGTQVSPQDGKDLQQLNEDFLFEYGTLQSQGKGNPALDAAKAMRNAKALHLQRLAKKKNKVAEPVKVDKKTKKDNITNLPLITPNKLQDQ